MPQLSITPGEFPQPSAGAGQALASIAEGWGALEIDPTLDFRAVLAGQLKGVATLLEQKEDARLSLAAVNESDEAVANAGVAMLPTDFPVLATPVFMLAPSVLAGDGDGIVAEVGAEQSLMCRNGNLVRADISRILADGDVGRSLMYRNGSELVVVSSGILAEVDLEKPLMYRNGSEVVMEGSSLSVEGGVNAPWMQLSRADEAQLAAEIAANGRNLPQAVTSERQLADKLSALVKIPEDNVDGGIRPVDLSAAVNPSSTVFGFGNSEPLPALPVVPRVGSAEWSGVVGEKVVWMASQRHQVAELHLNPPNLGPLEVRLTISNDQASALFVSHHIAVREAIEMALPRLREMLADNGIMLGNVTVGSESFGQQQASERGGDKKEERRGSLVVENAIARIAAPVLSAGLARDGMVDIFA